MDPERLIPRFAAERAEVEARWRAAPPGSAEAFAEADRLLRSWTEAVLDGPTTDRRPPWVRRYWQARDRRAGMPAAITSPTGRTTMNAAGRSAVGTAARRTRLASPIPRRR